jgi:hypothetical protein
MDCFTHRNIEMSIKLWIKIYQNIVYHLTVTWEVTTSK